MDEALPRRIRRDAAAEAAFAWITVFAVSAMLWDVADAVWLRAVAVAAPASMVVAALGLRSMHPA